MIYRLIVRISVILVIAAAVLFMIYRNRLPFGRNNSSFACKPNTEISGIEFSSQGKKLLLERKGADWEVNEGKEARKSGIHFILRVLHEIEIKSPVSAEIFESEIASRGIEPVKVRVFEERRLVKSFLVYKTASNAYGNIMKMRRGAKPFIVYVPGYDGDIGSAFTLSELFWLPYTVFNLLPSEIASVDFENFSDTSFSFSIKRNGREFGLSAPGGHVSGWDSSRVRRYISYFSYIPFEKWDLDLNADDKQRIESRGPLYRITAITTGGKKTVLTLWEKMKDQKEGGGPDSDRLLGKTQASGEFFVMRYFDIDPILKKRSYFRKE